MFINEMADLCERVGADITEVAHGIGSDSRIGPKFLQPGPGYGGSCYPKDMLALVKTGQDNNINITVIDTVIKSNTRRKLLMVEKIINALGGSVTSKVIGVLGLAFKANTDDMRESPSTDIIRMLQEEGAHITAYDPQAMEQAKTLLPHVMLCGDAYDCVRNVDAVVIVTEWEEFRNLDLVKIKNRMNDPVMIDLRNIYDPEVVRALGFSYTSIGR
jgi:UDPglucose 6-dehydrogenase